MGELRRRMEADLIIGGYSPGTQKIYLLYAYQFAAHHRRSPAEMGADEVRQFLLHLIVERGLSRSTLKQVRASLRFLYTVTLRRPIEIEWIPVSRQPQRLPDVLSGTEIQTFLEATRSLKYRAIFTTMYASGLRISEVCELRPENIDSKRMVIRNVGKGDKEHLALLSPRLLSHLREYWEATRPENGRLFPGRSNAGNISYESTRKAFHRALAAAGITKKVSPHVLRHSFATHLIDTGTDVTTVQVLLGHKSLRTTSVYTHTSVARIVQTRCPFDMLGTPDAQILG